MTLSRRNLIKSAAILGAGVPVAAIPDIGEWLRSSNTHTGIGYGTTPGGYMIPNDVAKRMIEGMEKLSFIRRME